MSVYVNNPQEIPLRLSALYERYGYSRYRMGKFDPYDFYMENKQFLKSEGIITFTDADGRLMALKPDVTMSIVKNVKPDGDPCKYYYHESVFRSERGEYREINQMGLEYIGGGADWAQSEAVSLAIDTLGAISREFSLDISHMGFIGALIGAAGLSGEGAEDMLASLRQKNTGGIADAARKYGVALSAREALIGLVSLRGKISEALPEARKLVICPEMDDALDELDALCKALQVLGKTAMLDFSVINDLDYYNGLVFRGYIRGAPRSVLAGGRYDNLMLRFNKGMTAVGFALYLSSLDRTMQSQSAYDVDVLIIYGDAAPSAIARAVTDIEGKGKSVRAERFPSNTIRAEQILRLEPNGAIEEVCSA